MTNYQPMGKDPSTAMIIEILAGFFGFLGIGYLYAGNTSGGILRLIGWWVVIAIGTVMSFVTLGLGFLCMGPLMLAGPIISGVMLKNSMQVRAR